MKLNFKNKMLLVLGVFAVALAIVSSSIATPVFLRKLLNSQPVGNQVSATVNTVSTKSNIQIDTQKTKKQNNSNFNSSAFAKKLTDDILNLNNEIRLKKSAKFDSKDVQKLINLAKARKVALKELIKQNPASFFYVAIPAGKRSLLPTEVQNEIEKETVVTGKVRVVHIDDFAEHKNSRFEYSIRQSNNKVLSFYPANNIILSSGSKVKITGYQMDDTIVSMADKKTFSVLEQAPKLDSVGDQKTLVLLVDFKDAPPPPFTKKEAENIIFNGQIQKFYKEQSYNQISFSGDVLDWYKLSKSQSQVCGYVTDSEIGEIITANNIDLVNYSRLLIIINSPGENCSSVGKSDVIINGNNYLLSMSYVGVYGVGIGVDVGKNPFYLDVFDLTTSHELGHSLGIMHANGWDCGDQVLRGDCQHLEYGNYFDDMGRKTYSRHFNAFYKELLGWINPSKIVNIDKTGVYYVSRLEEDGSSLVAKVQTRGSLSTTTAYYFEYRDGLGFDYVLNKSEYSITKGLFVNKIIKDYPNLPYPQIIDTNPTNMSWSDDLKNSTLSVKAQNIFDDSGNGIFIGPVITASSTGILFEAKIKEPYCIRYNPIINRFGNYYAQVGAGGGIGIQATLVNVDTYTCGGSNFTVSVEAPKSWTVHEHYDYSDGKLNLYPDELAPYGFSLSVPEDTLVGDYPVKIKMINLKTGAQTISESIINIVEKPSISEIKPILGMVGADIEIIGKGFSDYDNTIAFHKHDWSQFDYFYNVPSSTSGDIKTIKFIVPSYLNYPQHGLTTTGNYKIQIFASGSYSNEADFEITQSSSSSSSSSIGVSVSALSPKSGAVGIRVKISGDGFTATGNTVNFGKGVIPNATSADGKTIEFIIPASVNLACYYRVPKCLAPAIITRNGIYPVSVSNTNGVSNKIKFKVIK